jgi:hypothetical protein
LHQCIRPVIGACFAPGHHGYQRACDLISGKASRGHLGHQCSQTPGRPNLHIVSSSRRPRQLRLLGYIIGRSSISRWGCRYWSSIVGSWSGTAPVRRAGGSMQSRASARCWPPHWSPASAIPRHSSQGGTSRPGSGWCRNSAPVNARIARDDGER